MPKALRQQLARGEVVTHYYKTPAGLGTGWAMAIVNAPPEQVFAVIADVERYHEFFKRVVQSRIVARQLGSYDFYYKIDLPWPLSDLSCTTRNVHEIDRKKRRFKRSWTLLNGTFSHNQGYWLVQAYPDNKTLLTYSVLLRPKLSLPQSILNYVSKVALPRSVKAVRKRVGDLQKTRVNSKSSTKAP